MSKKYRKLRKKSNPYTHDSDNRAFSVSTRSPADKKHSIRLILILVAWSIFLTAVYNVCIAISFEPIMLIYTIMAVILFITYIFVNGGIYIRDLTKFEKPAEVGYDQFQEYLAYIKKRQNIAKYLLVAFIPFLFIMLIDYVIIVWSGRS